MKSTIALRFLLVFCCLIVNLVHAASIDGLRNAIVQRYGQEKIDLFKQCEGYRTKAEYSRTVQEKTELTKMQTFFLQDPNLALSMHINKFLGVLPVLKFSDSLISNIMRELVPQCKRLGISSSNFGYQSFDSSYGFTTGQNERTNYNVSSFDLTLEQIALSIKTAINTKHARVAADMVALAEETDWLRRVPRKTEQEIGKVKTVVDAMRSDIKLAPAIKMLKLIKSVRKLGYLSASTIAAIAQDLLGQCQRLGIVIERNNSIVYPSF